MQNTNQNTEKKPGFTPEQKKEMMLFVGLDVHDDNTEFVDITYEPDKKGRTVFVLGAYGLHARITGEFKGKVLDEKLGIELEKETDLDIVKSVKREFIFGLTINRHKITDEQMPKDEWLEKTKGGKEPFYLYNFIVTHQEGNIFLNGLSRETAMNFRKLFWAWMTFTRNIKQPE